MDAKVANKIITLKLWEKGDLRRVYLNARPDDGSKSVGRSYDWGYVDESGIHDSRYGGFSNYRYAKEIDPAGFEAMIESAKEMIGNE